MRHEIGEWYYEGSPGYRTRVVPWLEETIVGSMTMWTEHHPQTRRRFGLIDRIRRWCADLLMPSDEWCDMPKDEVK